MEETKQQRLEDYKNALARFAEALANADSELERDGAIQRFEFTVDLAWKVVKDALSAHGIMCASPRSCIQEAYRTSLVASLPEWLELIELRNLTSHTYDQEVAARVFTRLKDAHKLLQALHTSLTQAN